MTIWGNHSATQYPDLSARQVDGKPAKSLVEQKWIEETFIPIVQQRGAAVIKARGASSAASAASAAIDHVHTWVHGTAAGDWVSMAVPVRRQLRHQGRRDLLLSGHRARTVSIRSSQGLAIDEFSRKRMDATRRRAARGARRGEDLLG